LVAQSYDFTFTSTTNSDSGSGTLVTGASVSSGGYNVASGDIIFDGTPYSLIANPDPGSQQTSPNGAFYYDDIFYPGDNGTGGYLTNTAGLLFEDSSDNVLELNIWGPGSGYGPADTYALWLGTSSGNYGPTEDYGNFTVPEGGAALLYLLLAGGACFGGMFFIPRNRFANLASA
jgi:hypothetical protein